MISRKAHFTAVGRFDGERVARVTILVDDDTSRSVFSVRPFRRRRSYELPLADVAQLVLERVVRAELAAMKRERARRRAMHKRVAALEAEHRAGGSR